MTAIEFEGVSKVYSRAHGRLLLRGLLSRLFAGGGGEVFQALKSVSFAIGAGECVAIVGPNGAGKSTLLGLVAGISWPDSGTITINGRIATLLELGAGFHYDLTGAENLRLNASMLGLTRRRTSTLFDAIVGFSEMGEFIDQPLRTYSSGMIMRLAFSVAVNMEPEILLIDEVLAVGDQSFQAKCVDKIFELKRSGKTMLCVSHANSLIQDLCERALWLDHGGLMMDGPIRKVLDAYSGHAQADAAARRGGE